MADVRAGDRMVLKGGKSEIVAVGEVVERDGRCSGARDKSWLNDFDGWYLPAYCHVRWHRPSARDTSASSTATGLRSMP